MRLMVNWRTMRGWTPAGAALALLLTFSSAARAQDADSAWAAGNRELAGRLYAARLAADSNDVPALLRVATLASWQRRFRASRALYERVLTLSPDNVEALKGLARVASWSGDLRGGEAYWRRVLAVAPGDAEGSEGLATNLRWQGRDAASLAPRIAPTFVYEDDADGNTMQTWALAASFRPAEALSARVSGYRRALDGPGSDGDRLERNAYGASGGLTAHLSSGWLLSGSLGASFADYDDADVITTGHAALATPRHLPKALALTYARAAYDYTALLTARRVRTEQLSLDGSMRLSERSGLWVSGAVARWRGQLGNRQLTGTVVTTYRMNDVFTAGAAARAFGFAKGRGEFFDGYFNPDFYGVLEATLAGRMERGRLGFSAEVAPGVQQIDRGGARSGSLRTTGRLSYALAAGREMGVSGVYAQSGLNRLSPTADSSYRYHALTLFASWTF